MSVKELWKKLLEVVHREFNIQNYVKSKFWSKFEKIFTGIFSAIIFVVFILPFIFGKCIYRFYTNFVEKLFEPHILSFDPNNVYFFALLLYVLLVGFAIITLYFVVLRWRLYKHCLDLKVDNLFIALRTTTTAGTKADVRIKKNNYSFIFCPSGSFNTSRILNGQTAVLKIEIKEAFWILEVPVTQKMWTSVCKTNPSYFQLDSKHEKAKETLEKQNVKNTDNLPVETVSLFRSRTASNKPTCIDFIEGLDALIKKNRILSKGWFIDLPTRDEWEYACRAGTDTPYNTGNDITPNDANYKDTIGIPTPVRKYKSNGWGIYDMHGNVEEWAWRDKNQNDGVLCGGSWNDKKEDCRSDCIEPWDAHTASDRPQSTYGFRIILRQKPTEISIN